MYSEYWLRISRTSSFSRSSASISSVIRLLTISTTFCGAPVSITEGTRRATIWREIYPSNSLGISILLFPRQCNRSYGNRCFPFGEAGKDSGRRSAGNYEGPGCQPSVRDEHAGDHWSGDLADGSDRL